jgi:hypothetical protein
MGVKCSVTRYLLFFFLHLTFLFLFSRFPIIRFWVASMQVVPDQAYNIFPSLSIFVMDLALQAMSFHGAKRRYFCGLHHVWYGTRSSPWLEAIGIDTAVVSI